MSLLEDRRGSERKPKLPNSCDECKRRKVRCDSEMMPNNICSACMNSGVVCTHKKVQQKRGPRPGSVRTAASQPVNVMVANILAGTPSDPVDIPEDKEITRKILVKLASRIRDLEQELERVLAVQETLLQFKENSDMGSMVPSDSMNNEAVDYSNSVESLEETERVKHLTKQLSQLSFGRPGNSHYGESSNYMLMMTAMDHGKGLHNSNLPDWSAILSAVKRPEFWNITSWPIRYSSIEPYHPLKFPPEFLLDRYVDAYFEELNVYGPLLHRPTFQKSISDGLHFRDHAFGAVVLAVCALGAKLTSPYTTGDQWFSQICLERFVFSPKLELYHLQLYCLCMFHLQSTASGSDFIWLLAGIAVRRSQEIGAHRRSGIGSERPTAEGELWKRAFWMLIVLDTRMSTWFGRPGAISIQDFDLDPLIECDDEYWETGDQKKAFIQPRGKPSTMSYWNSYLRLTEIHGFALLTVYSVRKSELGSRMGIGNKEWYQKAVMELDSALNEWVDSVPDHLKWENQKDASTFFSQSAILYSLYYWIQIQAHRMFIPRPGHDSGILSFPSLAICMNAARSSIRVCEAHYMKTSSLYPYFLKPLFNSAVVLALNLARTTRQNANFDPTRELLDIQRCVELMRLYEVRYALAGRLVDQINMVMYASHYTPFSSSTSTYTAATDQASIFQRETYDATSHEQILDASLLATVANAENQDPRARSDPFSIYLPFYSNELGELPVHAGSTLNTSLGMHGTQYASNHKLDRANPGEEPYTSTSDERMLSHNSHSSDAQDWDSFMAGVDQLLNSCNKSGSNAFDPFNF